MADETLRLEDFLPYRLNRLAELVGRDFSRIYRERHGLTRPEWRLLATLGQYGRMTATEIGRHSSMHKTKVSRAVAALEKRRWLERHANEQDRRIELLSLTRAGSAAYRDLVPLAKDFEERILESLSASDQGAVRAGLTALEAAAGGRGRH